MQKNLFITEPDVNQVSLTQDLGYLRSEETRIGKKCYELTFKGGNGHFVAGFVKDQREIYFYYNNGSPQFTEYDETMKEINRISVGMNNPSFPLMICSDSSSNGIIAIDKNISYKYESTSFDGKGVLRVATFQGGTKFIDNMIYNYGIKKFANVIPIGYSTWMNKRGYFTCKRNKSRYISSYKFMFNIIALS